MPAPSRNISYNSGFNYDPYLQYDDYGAVIQIENVPVFYDYYGRIIRAGNVTMNYDLSGRLANVGGLNIFYNRFDQPVRYAGYINSYNSRYVYRPWHKYYVRPYDTRRIVYFQPYRTYYEPVRMNYGQYANYYEDNYYYNSQNYYRPGQDIVSYNNGRRTEIERSIASASPEVRSNQNSIRQNTTASNDRESYTNRNISSDRRSSANMERHLEAVRAQRGASAISNDVVRNTNTSTTSTARTSEYNSNTRTPDVSTSRNERTPARTSSRVESRNTTSTRSIPVSRPEVIKNDSSSRNASLPSTQAKAEVERPTRGRTSGGN